MRLSGHWAINFLYSRTIIPRASSPGSGCARFVQNSLNVDPTSSNKQRLLMPLSTSLRKLLCCAPVRQEEEEAPARRPLPEPMEAAPEPAQAGHRGHRHKQRRRCERSHRRRQRHGRGQMCRQFNRFKNPRGKRRTVPVRGDWGSQCRTVVPVRSDWRSRCRTTQIRSIRLFITGWTRKVDGPYPKGAVILGVIMYAGRIIIRFFVLSISFHGRYADGQSNDFFLSRISV